MSHPDVGDGERGLRKSITVVEASEFSAALRLDIAAARMAAITSPAMPTGRCCQMNKRIDFVADVGLLPMMVGIEHEQAHADDQKQRELDQDDDPTREKCGAALAFGAARRAGAAPSIVRCRGWRW